MKWFVIVNPSAGGGNALENWNRAKEMLNDYRVSFDHGITSSPDTTRSFAEEAVSKRYGGIAVYGGDGTLSDAASVLSGNLDIPLGIIPAGSGNDWARSIGFTVPSIHNGVSAIAKENCRIVDTAVARWRNEAKFFLNTSGIGFDAMVLKRAISLRNHLPLNRTCYWITLLLSALLPPVWQGEFSCDGKVFHRGGYLTFTAGVGCFSGGGMRLSPDAVPDDGKLDGLCLRPMSFFSIVSNLKKVFDGGLGKTKWSTGVRGDSIALKSMGNSRLLLELDGESVNLAGINSIELISVPGSLRVIAPQNYSHHLVNQRN